MRALTLLAKEVVGKEKEERVCYRLPRVFYYTSVEARESALLSIDLSGGIAEVSVFSFMR